MDIWKPVIGYEGLYEISNTAKVRSLDRMVYFEPKGNSGNAFKKGVEITPMMNEKGYYKISLCKNNKPKSYRRGRLVAIHFVPNPNNLPEVNHMNGDKANDNDWNLEWETRQGNIDHAYSVLRVNPIHVGERNNKSMAVLNVEYGIFYESITEAAASFGLKPLTLQAQLRGKNPKKYQLKICPKNVPQETVSA